MRRCLTGLYEMSVFLEPLRASARAEKLSSFFRLLRHQINQGLVAELSSLMQPVCPGKDAFPLWQPAGATSAVS